MGIYKGRKGDGWGQVIGIDGEGYTDEKNRHLYTYMAASTREGLVSELYAPKGLKAEDVFDWLISLPRKAIKIGFSLGYDKTKWWEDLPDSTIHALTHPETHRGLYYPEPIEWEGYELNAVSTKFTVKRLGLVTSHLVTVWDVFKFYGTSFVKALETWNVGTVEERAEIAAMKEKRGSFHGIKEKEKEYCRNECRLLAELGHALIDAHDGVGLPLKNFYGPGSTASIMLEKVKAREQTVKVRKGMKEAVACAFFGGRFETSRVGVVEGPVYSYDIASAYPYAIAQLPCLKHGRWEHRSYQRRGEPNRKAGMKPIIMNVRWSSVQDAWGALPHRLEDGNIVFPMYDYAGVWAWSSEVTASKGLANIVVDEAWEFIPRCDCPPPYAKAVASWYNDRCRWGKEGKGLTLKLGLNSMYGKRAQHVGGGKYRCMVAAGMTTSLCRAMILEAISKAKNPWSILSVATDGILSTERLDLPSPIDLGTGQLGKALGSWEEKVYPQGVFLIRPGLRFSLDDVSSAKETAARGLGVKVLHANRRKVLDQWARFPGQEVTVQQPDVFWGAKRCVAPVRNRPLEEWVYNTLSFKRHGLYGRWATPDPRRVGYEATPKRELVESNRWPGTGSRASFRILPWQKPPGNLPSFPYRAGAFPEIREDVEALGDDVETVIGEEA